MSLKFAISFMIIASLMGCIASISQYSDGIPKANLPPSYYAQWAHSHWVWLNNGIQNQTAMIDLIQGYLSRNISVGAIDIDSQWATGDNNFIVDTNKFPNMSQLVQDCHDQDIRVILWATSMIDTDSSNYQYGLDHKYFVTSGIPFYSGDEIKWWHGKGGLLDYSNPDAVNWWHSQMDNVLDIGVDGFKTDGTDPYIMELVVPWGHQGFISYRDYANMYYGDFFNYTRQVRGVDGLIMSRPVDAFESTVFWEFSPRYVVFSGWVGDEDPTFDGLVQALLRILHSAWDNYVNFGSDIGGYRSGTRTKETFIRWAQLGAFCPLMENGGEGPHLPWEFDDETVEIYRKYVVAHVELMPFFLTAGNAAWEAGNSVIQPLASQEDEITLSQPSTFNFILSGDILVAPITAANTTYVQVEFPSNNWVSYWNSSDVYLTGQSDLYLTPLDTLPVFKRTGAIIPMNVTSDYSYHGNSQSAGFLTLDIPHPAMGQSESLGIREMYTSGRVVNYNLTANGFFFSSTAHDTPLIILLEGVNLNEEGLLDYVNSLSLGSVSNFEAFQSSSQGFFFDESSNKLWIKYSQTANGTAFLFKGVQPLS